MSLFSNPGAVYTKKKTSSGSLNDTKQKSTQEMAIHQLTKLHEKYFGGSNNSEHTKDHFSTVAGSNIPPDKIAMKDFKPPHKKQTFKVQPPQIIQQLNSSVALPNKQAGSGWAEQNRLQ